MAALRALAESNSHHLRAISHDFRTPLQTVVATVELLTVVLAKSEERYVTEALRNLDTASKQLLQFSNELAQSIKNNAATITTKPVNTDLVELLNECIKQYEAESHPKEVALRLRHDNPSIEKVVDRARLHKIVSHLIDNAANETTDGVVQLECTRAVEGEVIVCFSYNGPLMSANDLPYIFEPWLLDEAAQKGVRLDLATAKAIAKSIGANLQINSSMASGTIVTLALW
jgi:signal transduction histidine kinase